MRDLRDTIRFLGRSPGFVATVTLTLGLAIAANTAVFSVLNGLVLRPLAAPDPERLVRLYPIDSQHVRQNLVPFDEYVAYRTAGNGVADLSAYIPEQVTLQAAGRTAATRVAYFVSGEYLSLLGARPIAGRLLHPDADHQGSRPIAVVSERFWRNELGGDADLAGQDVLVNGVHVPVVGVLPASFTGTEPLATDLWLPLSAHTELGTRGRDERAALPSVLVLARLRQEVTTARARDVFSAAAVSSSASRSPERRTAAVQVLRATFFPLDRDPLQAAGALLAALALVLAVASANVGNLVLTRILQRQRELAIRVSLGATRARLVGQLLLESACLAVLSAGVGLLACEWALSLLAPTALRFIPADWGAAVFDVSPDLRVFAYIAGIAALALTIAGLAPALAGTRLDFVAALHGQTVLGRRRLAGTWLRRALLTAQVIASTMLLAIGVLLARAARQAEVVDLGFDVAHVFVARTDLLRSGTPVAEAARATRAVLERTTKIPGANGAALVSHVPLTGGARFSNVTGDASPPVAARVVVTTPGYFPTLQVPFVAGHAFAATEFSSAVVSEVLAARLWPEGGWLGRRVRLSDTSREYDVVGVVRDTRASALWRDKEAAVYMAPSSENEIASLTLVVRARPEDDQLVRSAIAELVRDAAPHAPSRVERLADLVGLWTLPSRLAAAGSTGIAAAALALSLVGAYAATVFALGRRRRELGIRTALGASPTVILRVVMAEGLGIGVAGTAAGLGLAAVAGQAFRGMLFGVPPIDGPTFLATGVAVVATMAMACYLPARRVSRLAAAISLRSE